MAVLLDNQNRTRALTPEQKEGLSKLTFKPRTRQLTPEQKEGLSKLTFKPRTRRLDHA